MAKQHESMCVKRQVQALPEGHAAPGQEQSSPREGYPKGPEETGDFNLHAGSEHVSSGTYTFPSEEVKRATPDAQGTKQALKDKKCVLVCNFVKRKSYTETDVKLEDPFF